MATYGIQPIGNGMAYIVPNGQGPTFLVTQTQANDVLALVNGAMNLPIVSTTLGNLFGAIIQVNIVPTVDNGLPGDFKQNYNFIQQIEYQEGIINGSIIINNTPGVVDGTINISSNYAHYYTTATGSGTASIDEIAVFAHEILHANYGNHSWTLPNSGGLNSPSQVGSDPMYSAEAALMGQLGLAVFTPGVSGGDPLAADVQPGLPANTPGLPQGSQGLPQPGALLVSSDSSQLTNISQFYYDPSSMLVYYTNTINGVPNTPVYVVPPSVYALIRQNDVYDSLKKNPDGGGSEDAPVDIDPVTGQNIYAGLITLSQQQNIEAAGALSSALGSAIGDVLANGNQVDAVLYSSLLGQIGQQLGGAIAGGTNYAENLITNDAEQTLNTFAQGFGNALASNAAGTISSLLFAQLGQDLGIKGFGAQLGSNIVSTVTSDYVAHGLAQLWANTNPGSVVGPLNLASTIENSVGAFLGAKLGALIYSPQTQAGEVLSAIGSAVGAFEGTAIGADYIGNTLLSALIEGTSFNAPLTDLIGNLILPGIGALVGFVLGALIGDLFGSKPKIPTASADTILAIPAATYIVGNETSANGGDLAIATQMADTARDTLNGIIAQVTSNDPNAIVQNTSSPTQDYGYDSGGLYVKLNGAKTYVSSADQAVNMGVMWALPQTQIIGGDIFLKRAIANGSTTDLTILMGDLQIASDYEFYTQNRALINSEITAAYATLSSDEMAFYDNNKALVDQVDMSGVSSLNSSQLSTYYANEGAISDIVQALQAQSVANPWIVTLESASELKLDQWTPSDFYGGMYGLLSSFGLGNMSAGPHYENISFSWNGSALVASVGGAGTSETTTDPNSDAAQIYRLYEGLFGTAPDPGGWQYWVADLEDDIPITVVAQSFMNTPTFQNDAGTNISNAQLVQYLFETALHHAPGPPSTDGWVIDLDNGSLTPAQAAVGIAESQEAQNITAAAVSAGLNYPEAPGLNQFSSLTSSSLDGRSFTIDQADWQALGFTLGPTYSGAGAFVDYSTATWPLYIGPEPGNNIIIGGSGGNNITAGSGYDWIQGGAGTDTLTGGSGFDVIIAGSGTTTIFGGSGGGYFAAGDNIDPIFTGAGSATVVEGTGVTAQTIVFTTVDNSTIIASPLNDWTSIEPWPGHAQGVNNTLSFERFSYGVNANLNYHPSWWTSATNDPAASYLVQYDPSNPLGYDFSIGTTNVSNLVGSEYNDVLETNSNGGVLEGLGGADQLVGGGGITTASYQHSTSGVYVDLATDTGYGGDAQGDTFTNIQNLLGSSYDDELEGLPGSVLNGGPGDDTLDYSGGDNSYIGGGGVDTVDYATAPSAVYVSLQTNTGAWAAAGDTYSGISEIIGSPYNDVIIGSSTGTTFNGGGGADTFYGSGGDTYILDQGQGTEAIYDTNTATNTLQLGPGVTWDMIYFAAANGSNGYLVVGLLGTSTSATVFANFNNGNNNNILKTLDLDGASQLDISRTNYAPGVVNGALTGLDNKYNLLDANGALVPIYASGSAGAVSADGSVIIPGTGGHTIYASGAGDQFAMEYGDGQNYVYGAHQQNTIAFGSTVAASDVIYTVDASGNLYIGLESQSNPSLAANQVPDFIEFIGGGIETYNLNTDTKTFPASYLVEAGGTTVNLSEINIPWLVQRTTGRGGGGNLDPIVFDLKGDGLELSSVASSGIGTVDQNGVVTQLGWVGPDDGILVTDRGGNGAVNTTQDLSFVQDTPGATNDLQGLASWDTNGDGVLNASDTNWNQLEIWVDKNQDGVAEPGEVETMAQAGITSINLKGQASDVDPTTTTESYLVATTSFTTSDGSTGAAYDVSLANDLVGANGPGPSPYESPSQTASNATIGAIQTSTATPSKASTSSTVSASTSSASLSATKTISSTPQASLTSSSQGGKTVSVGGISINTSGTASAQTLGGALWAGAGAAAALGGDWSLTAPTGPPSAAALAEAALSGNGVAASTARNLEPIVLDLTGSGLSLIDPTASTVSGNFAHTGSSETVGWIGGADSVLAYAPGGASTIDPTSDLTFRNDLPGAETSIQGLKAFDTNGDGVINAQDASFANFYVWNDANGTGSVDPSQTETLAQAGIASISLTPTSLDRDDGDLSANQVIGQLQITMADGTTRTGYDVGLGVEGASTQTGGATSTPTAPSPPAVPAAALTDIASTTTAGTSSTAPSSQTAAASPSSSPAVAMAVSQARSAEDGPEGAQGAAVAPEVNTDPIVGWWSASSSQPASILNAATLASFGAPPLPTTGEAASAATSADAATMQRQLLLAQSITAFQGGGAAGSPVWNRGTGASDLSSLTLPTPARLPTPSAALPVAA